MKAYAPDSSRGLSTTTFANGEQCVIPKRFPLSAAQGPTKKEQELCSVDFYRAVTLTPKARSTSPAVLVSEPNDSKKVYAKFKQTLTGMDISSVLVYGRMAEYIGADLKVPASVLRTMEVDEHKKIQAQGLKTPLRDAWAAFSPYYRGTSPKTSEVITQDGQFIYGALSKNPRGEASYRSFNGPLKGVPYQKRMEGSLMKSKAFTLAANPKPLAAIFAADPTNVAQRTQWVRDMADMVLLDTLFGQRDRPFNIHTEKVALMPDNSFIDPGKAPAGTPQIDLLLLKDNDAGVSKGNRFRSSRVIEKIRHMHPRTYERLLGLADALRRDTGELKTYFLKEMLYTEADYAAFVSNVYHCEKVLSENRAKNLLHLDAVLPQGSNS